MNTVNYNDAEQLFGAVGTSLKEHTAEIADIVNVYGAKNLIPYPYYSTTFTINAVTCTDLGDGTFTVQTSSTGATADVNFRFIHNVPIGAKLSELLNHKALTISGCPSGGSDSKYYINVWGAQQSQSKRDYGEGKTFVADFNTKWGIAFTVKSGTVITTPITVKPMLRLASIQDDTWVPYVPTNKELMSCKLNGYVGAKNLLPYPYYNTTKTESGLTITDNGDGTVNVNGTATAVVRFRCTPTSNTWPNNPILKKGIPYILTGCAEGAGEPQSAIYSVTLYNSSDQVIGRDFGDGFTYIPSADEKLNSISIVIWTGAVCNNSVFKPMLRIALDSDSTYQPYAKTNKELTDDIASLAARIKAIEDTNHLTWG